MSQADLDRELARLFQEMRRAADALAPGFHQVLGQARPRGKAGWTTRVVIVAACAAVAVAALLVLRPSTAPPLPAAASLIARWESPTDFLLRTPGRDLLDRLPVLVPPVPSYARIEEKETWRAATPSPRKPSPELPNR